MDKNSFRFAFVGDVCLWGLGAAQSDISKFDGWSSIKESIGEDDFLVGNLECCLVDDRCGEDAWRPIMAVPAEAVSLLHSMGFSDLCLANNHILDCGAEAIDATREHLSSNGIRSFGAGANLHEAEEIVFVERGQRKIAFLGACDNSAYYATDDQAGVAPLEKARLTSRVRAAREAADIVVVTLHADLEFCDVPGRWRQRLSRWLIEQGAHLVIQHHPHVLQGVEMYRGGLIAYSLGNFIFKVRGNRYQQDRSGVFDSLVLVVDIDLREGKPNLAYRVVPVRIGDDHLPRCLKGPPREIAMQRLADLSTLVTDKAAHRRIWFRRCRTEAVKRLLGIYYALNRGEFERGARELWRLLACREDRRWLLGLLSLGYL